MKSARQPVTVGIFVFFGLILLAVLLVQFSRGTPFWVSTYQIELVTRNVAGIRPGAAVMMAGVPIGTVVGADLTADGRAVVIRLQILERYQIFHDAQFRIEQQGFLGDQYVAIVPMENQLPVLRPGDQVRADEPFNIQEIARSAAGLMERFDQTAARLNNAVARVDELLLSEETLTSLNVSVGNFRELSERAVSAVDQIQTFLNTNTPALTASVTNLVHFSSELSGVAQELRETLVTNRLQVTASLRNIESATIQADRLMSELQSGRGLVGALLKDDEMRLHGSMLLSNLTITSSNLNRQGLWRMLWRRAP